MEAVRDLTNLYIQRGYPPAVVRKWSKQYIHHRWQAKDLPKTETNESVMVLKTIINDTWDTFSIHDLSNTILQTIRKYTTEWRQRELGTLITANWESALIPTSALTPNHIDHFMEEFAGESLGNQSTPETVIKGLSVQTAPLMERFMDSTDEEGNPIKISVNLLNYEYWIIGDRRFLVSRKCSKNVGDLITQWCSSMVRAFLKYDENPASVMIAQAAQEYAEYEYSEQLCICQEAMDAWMEEHRIPGMKDALDFSNSPGQVPIQRQMTLTEVWSQSNMS